jgi:biotin carboxyl carrier protein
MAALTGPGVAPGALRVRVAPRSARPADEALTVGPDERARLEVAGPGRAILVAAGDGEGAPAVRTPLLVAPLRGADRSGPRLMEVVVDGWRFEVEVEPVARAALRDRASRDRRAMAHGLGAEVRAIIPGRVVAVSVAPGDPVTAGQQLLVVEAMKMQNEVRTPLAGVVERLVVAEGQTIELGDLLVVIGAGG